MKTENQEEGRQMGELLTTELTAQEIEKLEHCEEAISSSVDTMGSALTTIRDDRLYRAEHRTFEDYLKERWSMERRQAYRLIDAYRVRRSLVEKCVQMDTNVAQCRELASVKPDSLVAVVETAQQIALARGATKIASADIRNAKNMQSQTVNAESVVKVVENPKCVHLDTNVARPTEEPSLRLPECVVWASSSNGLGSYDAYDAIDLLTHTTDPAIAGYAVGSILIRNVWSDDLAKWIVLGFRSCVAYTDPESYSYSPPRMVESQLNEVIRQFVGASSELAKQPLAQTADVDVDQDQIDEFVRLWNQCSDIARIGIRSWLAENDPDTWMTTPEIPDPIGVEEDILKVLTTEWQTSRIIAMRVVLPPEIAHRRVHARQAKNVIEATVDIVDEALNNLCRAGKVEKRQKNEYRRISQATSDNQ